MDSPADSSDFIMPSFVIWSCILLINGTPASTMAFPTQAILQDYEGWYILTFWLK